MKAIYKTIFVIGLGITSLTVSAQKDTTLTRQVLLEREYNPTLQDASKINTTPNIYTPVIKQGNINFVSSTPQIKLENNQLGASAPGDIKTNVDFSKKRGYLILGGGTNGNLDGAAGYRILDSEKDRLDLFGDYDATSGKIYYLDKENYLNEDVKAKYSNAGVNLKYQHTFDPSILSIGASFRNTAYNYYGNSFYPKNGATNPYDYNSKQSVNVFNFGIGLRSSEKNGGSLKYIGNIAFTHFDSKYGTSSLEDGLKGEQLDLGVNVFTEFDTDKTFGIDGSIMYQTISDQDWFIDEDAYHKFFNVQGTPYIKFLGANWDVNLGANVNFLFDTKVAFSIAPNIKANVRINDVNKFYAEIGGGVNNNTFLDILQENRYVNPATRVEYSKTLYDAKVGFTSGVVSGLEFDIFAGYKQTNKDHLYVYTPSGATSAWSLVGTPLYANVSTGHFGGQLKTALIPCTDLSAKITAYFYNVKYRDGYVTMILPEAISEKKAWGRPSFTAELNADVKPIDKLILSVNYLYGGGRKSVYVDPVFASEWTSVKMKNINELNFRGEYQVTDWLSVNARLNNILYQRYELYYGYPLQGFNILGGVSLKF
ncbi:MAG: hypothetical protein ACK5M3_18725 [Dysgonomonas sp.]